jgi:HK97 family phage major capsid protein
VSERYTDIERKIQQFVVDQQARTAREEEISAQFMKAYHDCQKQAEQTVDARLGPIERTLAALLDRVEERESRGTSPGRVATMSTKAVEHRQLFVDWLRKPRDVVRQERLSNFEAEHKDVTIGTGAAGGFAVPEEIGREVGRLELLYSPVRSLVRVVRAGTSDYKELVDITGTTSGWVGETTTRTATLTPSLRERTPTHGEIYAYPQASNWSLDDMFFNVQEWLVQSVAREFAVQEGTAVISGNGSNKPTGMTNTAPAVTTDFASPPRSAEAYEAIESDLTPGGQGIVADNLIDLVYRVNSAYRSRGVFVMNSATAAAVRKLKDDNDMYLWAPGLAAGQPDRLLGYPVSVWEQMADIGAGAFPVAFGDFARGYLLVDRSEIRVTVDNVTTPGYTKFYVRRREGGIVLDNHAIKFLKTL